MRYSHLIKTAATAKAAVGTVGAQRLFDRWQEATSEDVRQARSVVLAIFNEVPKSDGTLYLLDGYSEAMIMAFTPADVVGRAFLSVMLTPVFGFAGCFVGSAVVGRLGRRPRDVSSGV